MPEDGDHYLVNRFAVFPLEPVEPGGVRRLGSEFGVRYNSGKKVKGVWTRETNNRQSGDSGWCGWCDDCIRLHWLFKIRVPPER